ncbi:MAG: hypothetical protein II336_15365 [Loktanella sp.]|nr:hypothetical protein [Loktanella sp.]
MPNLFNEEQVVDLLSLDFTIPCNTPDVAHVILPDQTLLTIQKMPHSYLMEMDTYDTMSALLEALYREHLLASVVS